MIFWLFCILVAIGIVLAVIGWSALCADGVFVGGVLLSVCAGIVAIIMLIFIIITNVSADGYKAANEERYKALMYKAQTEQCRDEFGLLNKDFIDEVQEWNEDVVQYKTYSQNVWIGIFYPENSFKDFETIDLEQFEFAED